MKYVEVDHVLPVSEIGPLITRLARKSAPAEAAPVPEDMVKEAKLAERSSSETCFSRRRASSVRAHGTSVRGV
jgi:hypothetical protein